MSAGWLGDGDAERGTICDATFKNFSWFSEAIDNIFSGELVVEFVNHGTVCGPD